MIDKLWHYAKFWVQFMQSKVVWREVFVCALVKFFIFHHLMYLNASLYLFDLT